MSEEQISYKPVHNVGSNKQWRKYLFSYEPNNEITVIQGLTTQIKVQKEGGKTDINREKNLWSVFASISLCTI